MWSFLVYGAVLGLSAGLSPGPLLALVVSQTLRHGTREGLRVAAAPLFTDVPIICLGLILFASLKEPDFVLGVLSFIGCAFVGYLGLTSLRQQPVELDLPQDAPRSYFKGMLTNALSPHPYLFWFSVGIPTILKANSQSLPSALGFMASFYVCIVGSKMVLALVVGRSRSFLTGARYLWSVKCLGILLIGFSLVLFYDGLTLTGLVQ
jgi:threonine/homoserine/homoserine lactone efflux protein